jgi:DNA-binding XRE family transcriptional regulator
MAAVSPGTRRHRFAQRRKAVGFTQESLAALLTVERSTVVRWEAGKSEPLAWLWPRLAAALEITPEQLIDLLAEGSANSADTDGQVEDDVNRRELLKVLGVGAGTAALSGALDTYAPALRINPGIAASGAGATSTTGSPVDAISGITVSYRSVEAYTPSRQLINPVRAHLDFIRLRLEDSDGIGIIPSWATVSEVAGLAAWLYMDLYDLKAARDHYRLAISHAKQSRHQLLASYMIGSLVQLAIELRDSIQALQLAQQARHELPDNAPDMARAWILVMESLALGSSGEKEQAMRSFDKAHHLVSRADSGPPPVWPWVFAFDHGKVDAYRSLVLARNGHIDMSFDAGALGKSPKQHAINTVAIAHGMAKNGAIEEASLLAAQALDVGQKLGSERIVRHVMTLNNRLPDSQAPEVRLLKTRLSEVY